MKIAFTGTRTPANQEEVKLILDDLIGRYPTATWITGACVGIDVLVARYGNEKGITVHTVVPSKRDQVDPSWRENCSTFELMPPGGKEPYRERNTRMVDLCDALVAFPGGTEKSQPRSGTWMTIRIARKMGKKTRITLV